jgi:hypothetical protein
MFPLRLKVLDFVQSSKLPQEEIPMSNVNRRTALVRMTARAGAPLVVNRHRADSVNNQLTEKA